MLFPGGHAASICDNTPELGVGVGEAICRVLEEEEDSAVKATGAILFLKSAIYSEEEE
jgi:hypothetical protein